MTEENKGGVPILQGSGAGVVAARPEAAPYHFRSRGTRDPTDAAKMAALHTAATSATAPAQSGETPLPPGEPQSGETPLPRMVATSRMGDRRGLRRGA